MKLNKFSPIYAANHFYFFDKILLKKRLELVNLINEFFKNINMYDVLDIGATNDKENSSSNFIIKNLTNFKIYKSISDQKINLDLFNKSLNKSIINDFTKNEIEQFSSDLVISNATIEHVGNYHNQIKMVENVIKLSKKYFIIITPNRHHPIELHTKLPLLHWFPKKIHRLILSILGFKDLSKEENLNLLSKKDLISIMNKLNQKNFIIKHIKFIFFKSNFILIGKKC